MNFKIGDDPRITANTNSYCFDIDDEVTLSELSLSNRKLFRDDDKSLGCVFSCEMELVHEKKR